MDLRNNEKIVYTASKYTNLSKGSFFHRGKCPFCNKSSFLIDEKKNCFICLSCGKAGDANFLQIEKDNKDAFDLLNKAKHAEDLTEKIELYVIYKVVSDYFHKRLMEKDNKGYQYLSERGITETSMKRFKLGFCDRRMEIFGKLLDMGFSEERLYTCGIFSKYEISDIIYCRFYNRVIFPIFDALGRVVAFGGRVMDNKKEPKYLNSSESPIYSKSTILYGLNFAKNIKTDTLMICEGYLDVITLHQAGFSNAVAPLGTAFTKTHADLIKRFSHIILMQDSDEAGILAKEKTYNILTKKGFLVSFIDLYPAKDPDEFLNANSVDDLRILLKTPLSKLKYDILIAKRKYKREDIKEYQAYIKDISNRIFKLS